MSDVSNNKPVRDFRDLLVWQKAHQLLYGLQKANKKKGDEASV